jgi:hypothetical protein
MGAGLRHTEPNGVSPVPRTATVSGSQFVSRPFFKAASTMIAACCSVTLDI